jgi:hypothetical protein
MSDATRLIQTPVESIAELYRRVRDLEFRRATDVSNYLPLSGGTLTGPLYLPSANPTSGVQATHKSYVDAAAAAAAAESAGGYIAHATGPAAQTDFTGVAIVATFTATVAAGRAYEISAYFFGTQITNAGAPSVRLSGTSGNPTNFLFFQQVGANTTVYGSTTALLLPSSTAARNFQLTAQSTAAALRIPANAGVLLLKDLGPT